MARLVSYVPQRPVIPAAMSVTDYVMLGRSAHHSTSGLRRAGTGVLSPPCWSDSISPHLPVVASLRSPVVSANASYCVALSPRRHLC